MQKQKEQAANLAVVVAGGTGGHIFPALATAETLQQLGIGVLFITDARGAKLLENNSRLNVYQVPSRSIYQGGFIHRLAAIWQILRGIRACLSIFSVTRPAVIFGFGGYATVPALTAAKIKKISIIIQEQNAILGRTNRYFFRFARYIASGFPKLEKAPPVFKNKIRHTGTPLRESFLAIEAKPPALSKKIRLTIIGGSLGATIFSDIVPAAIANLPDALQKKLEIVQQCRPEDLERVTNIYKNLAIKATLAPFFTDMPQHLATTHLAICRAGASTVAELQILGVPAILVPYPSAMDDHQTANAKQLADVGAGWLLPQPDFTNEALTALLTKILTNPEMLEQASIKALQLARPQAAVDLVNLAFPPSSSS